jgi:hypothetical protein
MRRLKSLRRRERPLLDRGACTVARAAIVAAAQQRRPEEFPPRRAVVRRRNEHPQDGDKAGPARFAKSGRPNSGERPKCTDFLRYGALLVNSDAAATLDTRRPACRCLKGIN